MSEQPVGIEPDLGYRFWPKRYPQSAGHPRLEIKITATPSERHFDPYLMQLPIFIRAEGKHAQRIVHLKVHHPWPHETSYHLAPGMIVISDRIERKVEAFTFGGGMQISTEDEDTKCVIDSEAPIIEIETADAPIMMLVDEVSILLAEQRAVWSHNQNEQGFETRLAGISPSLLYAAILEELAKKTEHIQYQNTPGIRDFHQFIAAEKRNLAKAGLWPKVVPPISEVL